MLCQKIHEDSGKTAIDADKTSRTNEHMRYFWLHVGQETIVVRMFDILDSSGTRMRLY